MIKTREWLLSLCVILASLAVSSFLSSGVQKRLLHTDARLIDSLFARFQADLREREFAVEQIANAWSLIQSPDNDGWQLLTQLYLTEYPESPGLVWAPLLDHSERAEFETTHFSGYKSIKAIQDNAPPKASPQKIRYAPIQFFGGRGDTVNNPAIGLDLLSETSRRLMLERSEGSRKTVFSQPINLISHLDQPAILISNWVQTPQKAGFVSGAYLTQPMIARTLDASSFGGQLWIQDSANPDLLIYPGGSAQDIPAGATRNQTRYQHSISIGGRNWQVTLDRPSPTLPLWPHSIWIVTLFAVGALLIYLWRFRRSEAQYETRLSQATRALTDTNLALTNKNRELESFAYAASHDLQAPLRGIRNITQWLGEDLPPNQISNEVSDYLLRLDTLSQKMSGMVSGLLTYSRAGEASEPNQWVELDTLVSRIRQEKNLGGVHCRSTAAMNTQACHLASVLGVLLENAIKHNDNNEPQVWIIQDEEHPNCIWICDNGSGIAAHQSERAFEIFQTLKPGPSDQVAGMGLAIARKLVRSVGGTLEIKPYQDFTGACFELYWPCDTQGKTL